MLHMHYRNMLINILKYIFLNEMLYFNEMLFANNFILELVSGFLHLHLRTLVTKNVHVSIS